MTVQKRLVNPAVLQLLTMAVALFTTSRFVIEDSEAGGAEKPDPSVRVEASRDGFNELSIRMGELVLDVHRFDFTSQDRRLLSLKVVGVSGKAVHEFASVQIQITGDGGKGTVYVATPTSAPAQNDTKELIVACSIIGNTGVQATSEPYQIDSRFRFVAMAMKRVVEIPEEGQAILFANCWLSTDSDSREGKIHDDLPYSSWNKDAIIKEVKKRGDAFVILVLMDSD